jgi:catechol-2,3-dioxygenase
MATMTSPETETFSEENIGNIMLMEHVNLPVPDQGIATLFYLVGMGFTRDPHMMVGLENMWVNLGEQQFHLPTNNPQVLRGHIGVVTPSLDALADRLESIKPRLADTKFAYERKDGYIEITCPWGNTMRAYEPAEEFGNIVTGIPYVEFTVPVGTADGIMRFYTQVMGAVASVEDAGGKAAVVEVGNYQRLVFRETENVPEYDGHHIAVYVANFSAPFNYLKERGLVTEDPRNHQFRFVSIIDPDTGEKLFDVEHEVRGMRHALYRRPLVNRTVGQFQEPRRVNGMTLMGQVM